MTVAEDAVAHFGQPVPQCLHNRCTGIAPPLPMLNIEAGRTAAGPSGPAETSATGVPIMNKIRAATLTLAAILSGAAALQAGSVLAQQASPSVGQPPAPWPCPRGGMGRGGWAAASDPTQAHLDRMAWRLGLTQEQKTKLEPIVRQQDQVRAAQRQAMRNEIAAILTPEQLAQFDRMGPRSVGASAPTTSVPATQP